MDLSSSYSKRQTIPGCLSLDLFFLPFLCSPLAFWSSLYSWPQIPFYIDNWQVLYSFSDTDFSKSVCPPDISIWESKWYLKSNTTIQLLFFVDLLALLLSHRPHFSEWHNHTAPCSRQKSLYYFCSLYFPYIYISPSVKPTNSISKSILNRFFFHFSSSFLPP